MQADPGHMAMLGGVRDAAETRAYLDRNLQHWDDHGFGLWILREAAGGPAIGRALLRYLALEDWNEVEVGYGFQPECWGRGLATEIAAACVRLGVEQLGLRSIVAITTRENLASQRVLVKAGLLPAGEVAHAGMSHALYRLRVSGER